MTLVEVIIVIFASTLLVGLLAALLGNGLTAQRQATARDHATGKALVVSASLQSSIRNATAVAVDATGLRVDAVVVGPAGAFECRAWAIDAGGALRYSAGPDARGAAISGWKALAEGVSGILASGMAFTADGARGIDIGIAVTMGDATVPFTEGVTAQAVASGGGAPACW